MPDTSAEPPAPAPRRPTVARVRLSPVQRTYGAYVTHYLACPDCRDIDYGRCDTAAGLWASYQQVAAAAVDRVRAAGVRPTEP